MASTLTEELIEQILIRIPPEEPAHLVRAALVCKSWHGVLYDRGFRCRYREFHGTPPLFGYFQNHDLGDARFFPTTATASPVSTAALRTLDQTNWAALDCRHGRVLIYICDDPFAERERLIVWDPIAGRRQRLTVPPYLRPRHSLSCAGSVLCAANDCDHLSCSSGPYAVVFVWTWMKYAGGNMTTWASIYSSETGAWSAPASAHIHCYVDMSPGVFIGAALYFTITVNGGQRILKYDLHGHGLSVIETPPVTWTTLVMKGEEDGGLELVTLSDNCIYMWSSQQDVSHGIGGWVKHKVMELPALLPEHGSYTREVIGFVEGTDIVFVTTYEGIFTLCLRSRQVRKVFERETYYMYPILPCMSFCIPR